MREVISTILEFLPSIVVGAVVYYFMRIKCNEEVQKASHEAYYKGQDDCLKSIPTEAERLKNLREQYSEEFNKNWASHNKDYRIGLIDGSRYIFQKKQLGEYSVADGVEVLKANRFRPHNTMHWSESEVYDEIIEEYQWETRDFDS